MSTRTPWKARVMLAVALLACLFVGLRQHDSREKMHTCSSNLTNIFIAINGYTIDSRGVFPAGTEYPALSWLTSIHNYRATASGYLFQSNLPWNARENLYPFVGVRGKILGRLPEPPTNSYLTCPGATLKEQQGLPGPTSYIGIAGLGTDSVNLPVTHPRAGVFAFNRRTSSSDIVDGQSHTIMVAELHEANGSWTAGGLSSMRGLDPSRRPYVGKGSQFGGNHSDGVYLLFADGSVRFVKQSIDEMRFEAMSTIAGHD